MNQKKCKDCEKYKERHHNYCRMCGYHLTKGYVQYVRQALVYFTNEKHCGHCGNLRENCTC